MIIVFQSIDDSRNAIFDQRHVEVDQQAKTLVGQSEIGQQLLLVDRGQRLDRFDLHNDLVFDHQVGAEAGIDPDILIDHRNGLLAYGAETATAQFIRQDCLINRFQ